MARAIWTGALAFGLVNVPVGLYAATEDKTVHFNQFQAGTSDRIRYQRVNERTGKEVDRSDIVSGHEVGNGDYVMLSDEELAAADPDRSRTIDISDFVELADIDPVYFQKTYYLAPQSEDANRPYALLRQAMAETNRAGIAQFVMHGKEHLVAVRPDADVLALETMFFADEVRNPRQVIGSLPGKTRSRGQELDIAKQIIESMTTDWRPGNYHDTYREQLSKLIDRKRRGEEIVTEGEEPAESNVVDLMEALRQSADAARGQRGGGRKRGAGSGGSRGTSGGSSRTGGSGRSRSGGSRGGGSSRSGSSGRSSRRQGGSRGRRQAAR